MTRYRTVRRQLTLLSGLAVAHLAVLSVCAGLASAMDPPPEGEMKSRPAAAPTRSDSPPSPVHLEIRRASSTPVEGWGEHRLGEDGPTVFVSPTVELDGDDVARAWYQPQGPDHCVGLYLTEDGALALARLTRSSIGQRLAILLDGTLVSAPRIAAEIPSGRALIHGRLTEDEARSVAAALNGEEEP